MTCLLLVFAAFAHDLQVQVKVPGAEPVWTTLLDARPGATQTITFPAGRRTVYALRTTVEEPAEGYDWRVRFELSAREGKAPEALIFRPTMQADTGQLAQVTSGSTRPVVGSEAPAVVFEGYEILWIMRPPEE